jgi:hypothetical protein
MFAALRMIKRAAFSLAGPATDVVAPVAGVPLVSHPDKAAHVSASAVIRKA